MYKTKINLILTVISFVCLSFIFSNKTSICLAVDAESSLFTTHNISMNVYKGLSGYSVTGDILVGTGKFHYKDSFEEFKGRVYDGNILSFQGKSLGYFEVPSGMSIRRCYDKIDKVTKKITGGCEYLSEGNIMLQMPYFPNGKTVEIFSDKGEKVFVADISSVATCNENGKCEAPKETIQECPLDCSEEKNTIVPLTASAETGFPVKWVVVGVTFFLGVLVVVTVYYRRRKYTN